MRIYLPVLILCFLNVGLTQQPLTLRVNMKEPMQHDVFNPAKGDSLVIRGNFNMWQGNHFYLTDQDKDSVFTIRFDPKAASGNTMEFKYVVVKNNGPDIWEHFPQEDNPPYGNRLLNLTDQASSPEQAQFDVSPYWIDANFQFNATDLKDDLQQLRLTIEGLHPAFYDFTSESQFDSLYKESVSQLDRPLTGAEFFKVVTPIITAIGCGHSTVSMPNEWWVNKPDHYFPFRLIIQDKRAYILTSDSKSSKPQIGSEIIFINGTPMNEIIENLIKVTSSDGDRVGYKASQLSRRFASLYASYYGFPQKFEVVYRTEQSKKPESIVIAAASERQLAVGQIRTPGLAYETLMPSKVGVLTIQHFNYYQDPSRFTTFLDSVFAVLKKEDTNKLILDLRDNDGGDPFSSAYLFSYLIDKPVPYFAAKYGRYEKLAEPVTPQMNAFSGDLAILINGRCFSTTGHLCALLRYHKIGTFVGEETGGTFTCNDAKATLPLKNTMLRLQVAQRTFAVAVEGMDVNYGVQPDYPVRHSVEDLKHGVDTVKKFAIRFVSGNKQE